MLRTRCLSNKTEWNLRGLIMYDTAFKKQSRITSAAGIISTYVSKNKVRVPQLLSMIEDVGNILERIDRPVRERGRNSDGHKPSESQIKNSITPEALISFENGKPYKTLRRHLSVRGLTPAAYREKWGLGADYPMVAPMYSERRAQIAKDIGLGQTMTDVDRTDPS
jgi:predicted transcriptional regulator